MSEENEKPEEKQPADGQAAGPSGGHNRSGHDEKTLRAIIRQDEVCRLRMLGWSYEEIAKEVGYASKSGAQAAFQAAMKNYSVPNVEEFRAVFLSGWLQVWRANLPGATGNPDDTGRPTGDVSKDAVDNLDKASKHIEAITGLAVKRLELTGKDGAPLVPTDLSKLSDDELESLARGPGKA